MREARDADRWGRILTPMLARSLYSTIAVQHDCCTARLLYSTIAVQHDCCTNEAYLGFLFGLFDEFFNLTEEHVIARRVVSSERNHTVCQAISSEHSLNDCCYFMTAMITGERCERKQRFSAFPFVGDPVAFDSQEACTFGVGPRVEDNGDLDWAGWQTLLGTLLDIVSEIVDASSECGWARKLEQRIKRSDKGPHVWMVDEGEG